MDFDVLAFIGRFQPFHNGHKAVVEQALTRAKKVAIVLGSHDQPRNPRVPFTTAERVEMISAVFPQEVADGRIQFVPVVDHTYNMDRWIASVQAGVSVVANRPFTPDPVRIGLIGHSKDASSFYLKSFPTWESIEVANVEGINATDIRKDFFGGWIDGVGIDVPDGVFQWLQEFEDTASYEQVKEEIAFVTDYKRQWIKAPYPPTFQTTDAIVTQSGHVLLIQRRAAPGKGLWALPGGYLEQDETLMDGMLRELREETRIALSEETLRRCIRSWRTFDDPNRSPRGRTITTAYRIELRDETSLTKVKGGDDAAKAKWVPLSQVSRAAMFEDHYDILVSMGVI